MKNWIVYILCDIVYLFGLIVSIIQKNVLGIGAYVCLMINMATTMLWHKNCNKLYNRNDELFKSNLRLTFLLNIEKQKNKDLKGE